MTTPDTTRFRCPVCGHGVTLHITPTNTPICAHHNTIHDRHRPTPMTAEGGEP